MSNFLSNAFTLNQLPASVDFGLVRFEKIEPSMVPADIVSAIGHADLAKIVSELLGFEVPANRVTIELAEDDVLYIAQYRGPRLPEGATTLPEGAKIEFFKVDYITNPCKNCYGTECEFCSIPAWVKGV